MITEISYTYNHQHSTDFNDYFNLYADKPIESLNTTCGCSEAQFTPEGIHFNTNYSKFPHPQFQLPNYSKDNNKYIKTYSLIINYEDNTKTKVNYKLIVDDKD